MGSALEEGRTGGWETRLSLLRRSRRGGGLNKWGECGGEEGGTHGTLRKSVWGCDVHSVHEPEGRCAYEEK